MNQTKTLNDAIETQRLIIRRWKQSDLKDFNEYGSQPYVALRTGYDTHKSLDDSKEILDKFIVDPTKWAIELKENGKVIGGIGLEIRNKEDLEAIERERELGYTLNQKFHGHGYMTEASKALLDYAFEQLKLVIVRISHCNANDQSRRVIEKCGFVYEGKKRLQQVWKFDNELHDFLHYSMTKDEWKQLKAECKNEK